MQVNTLNRMGMVHAGLFTKLFQGQHLKSDGQQNVDAEEDDLAMAQALQYWTDVIKSWVNFF